jgi:predicted ribosomally synthesized peptide with nif11-like leader
MTLPSLAAFLEAASADEGLQEQLATAADAASLAAIARAAGFAVGEADWLAASDAGQPERAADAWRALAADPWAEDSSPSPAEPVTQPDPSADPLSAFLHQAQGDPALWEALAQAPDAAAVAALAQQAGYPLSSAALWAASEAVPEELLSSPPSSPPASAQEDTAEQEIEQEIEEEKVLESFLRQLEGDAELQRALAEAADAAAVALLAQAAGHPLREVDLWLASGLEPQHLAQPPLPVVTPGEAALLAFLHQAQADAALLEVLAEAADAAEVAAIARGAGYSITPADLWAASGAEPEELVVPLLVFEA